MQETVIKLEHITREFPGVLANDDVSLEIHRGEVFALVGENGAGKSTLMNIIYGIFPPTDGSVYIRGKKVETFSPKNAIDMGIGMVHQHFMLVPSLTVAENMVLGMAPRKGLFIDHAKAVAITKEYAEKYNLHVEPEAKVMDIPVGMKQKVEILKALVRGAKILILDDSTSAVDTKTDKLIRNAFHNEIPDTTKIIIAQRVASVEESDMILVMDNGRIMASGTHDELLATCDEYRSIYESQTKNQARPEELVAAEPAGAQSETETKEGETR